MKKNILPGAVVLVILLLVMGGILFLHGRMAAAEAPVIEEPADEVFAEEEMPANVEEEAPAAPEEPAAEAPAEAAPIAEEEAPAEPEEPAAPPADPDSPAGRAYALGLPAPPEVDVNSWELALVNIDHVLVTRPENMGYVSQTAFLKDIQPDFNPNRCGVDARVAQPLLDMAEACKAEGLPILFVDGYRNNAEQDAIFGAALKANGSTDGRNADGLYFIFPSGYSEYQTGLAVDITDKYREVKVAERIAQTDTYAWLMEHCAEYGFILRNPEGKSEITKSVFEPWHFRYVGPEAAAYIMENNLCLEEFLALYGVQ